jgi:hypothetical protein
LGLGQPSLGPKAGEALTESEARGDLSGHDRKSTRGSEGP